MLGRIYRRYHTEIDQFHIRRRRKRYERSKGKVKAIPLHNALHYILFYGVKVLRLIHRQQLIIVADRRTPPPQKRQLFMHVPMLAGMM